MKMTLKGLYLILFAAYITETSATPVKIERRSVGFDDVPIQEQVSINDDSWKEQSSAWKQEDLGWKQESWKQEPQTITVEKHVPIYKPVYIEKKVAVPQKVVVERKIPVLFERGQVEDLNRPRINVNVVDQRQNPAANNQRIDINTLVRIISLLLQQRDSTIPLSPLDPILGQIPQEDITQAIAGLVTRQNQGLGGFLI